MEHIFGNSVVIDGGEIGLCSCLDGGEMCLTCQTGGDLGTFNTSSMGTMFHEKLKHRDYPDQHPIEAITGLREELDGKADLSDFSIIYCGTSTEVV